MGQKGPFKPTEFTRTAEHKLHLTDVALFLQPLSSHKLTTFLHHSDTEKPPSRIKIQSTDHCRSCYNLAIEGGTDCSAFWEGSCFYPLKYWFWCWKLRGIWTWTLLKISAKLSLAQAPPAEGSRFLSLPEVDVGWGTRAGAGFALQGFVQRLCSCLQQAPCGSQTGHRRTGQNFNIGTTFLSSLP